MLKIFTILKKIISYFQVIDIYENTGSCLKFSEKGYRLNIYNSLNKIKDKKILEYFARFKNKQERFSMKQTFLVLTKKNVFVSSGWMSHRKKWHIEEIDKKINFQNAIILFDFITLKEKRNRGYYTKLLSLINKRFKNKKLIIYTLRKNILSAKAIKKSGFIYKKTLKKL